MELDIVFDNINNFISKIPVFERRDKNIFRLF